jgi:hypothetical protein
MLHPLDAPPHVASLKFNAYCVPNDDAAAQLQARCIYVR